jgi:hypothetical protein
MKSNLFSHFFAFIQKNVFGTFFPSQSTSFYIKNVSLKQKRQNFQTGRGSALE